MIEDQLHFNPYPDPAFYWNADPDPDTASQRNADPTLVFNRKKRR
jgi:hypothetical protein